MITDAFRRYFRGSPSDFELAVLLKMPATELITLCGLLGIAHSGTRPQVAERLMTLGALRVRLKDYGDDHAAVQALAAAYKGVELKEMARSAGLWIAPNKVAQAASLLTWRNKCRRLGQTYLAELRAGQRGLPKQLVMDLANEAEARSA